MSVLSDPWRLCCPECGCQPHKSAAEHWYCQNCNEPREQVRDKRTGRLLSKNEVTP